MASARRTRARDTSSIGAAGPLRRRTFQMLILLLIQFGLGTATNLYVTVPAEHPGAHANAYFSGLMQGIGWVIPNGAVVLAAHAALGLALILVGLDLLVRSIVTKSLPRRATLFWSNLIGVAAIIGAGFNGISFLNYNHNVSSLVMALLFALAVAAYVVELYLIPLPTSAISR